jgi:hypothetical protein
MRGLCALLVALCVSACSGKQQGAYSSVASLQREEYLTVNDEARVAGAYATARDSTDMEIAEEEADNAMGAKAGAEISRKLVSTARLSLRLSDLEAGEKRLAQFMETYDTWTAATHIYENSRAYTLKVPADAYKPLLVDLMSMGHILSYSENTEDVTLRYYDLESRLETQRELLKTFQAYLAKAGTIEEILSVETRIAELQGEIERTGTQFRSLAHLVDYATIELQLAGPLATPSYGRPSIGERISGLFSHFGDYASTVLVILVGVIIYGLPSLVVLLVLYWLLLGKVGLLKKVWRIFSGHKTHTKEG